MTKVKMFNGNHHTFVVACAKADTPPTHRQYRKWCQGRGKAFRAHHNLD